MVTAALATIGLSLALALGAAPAGAVDTDPDPTPRTWTAVTTRTIVPTRLPRGRDAAIDFMQDRVIHTADGRTLPVPTPANTKQIHLLGASRMGWLVAVHVGCDSRVIAVRPHRRAVEVPHARNETFCDEEVGWRAARDGELLMLTSFDRGGSYFDVKDLDGKRLGSAGSTAWVKPFDADAGHVLAYLEDKSWRVRLMDWVPRDSRKEIVKEAAYASLREDLVFVHTRGPFFGPTSVSAPTTPAWAAPFAPLAVSPDGAMAIGTRASRSTFDRPAVLDVRRMADGALLDSIQFGPRITEDNWVVGKDHEQTARWESNRSFVFQLDSPRGAVLVRCRLGGACQRASDFGRDISTPYEDFLWSEPTGPGAP